jgi:CheY-like chemotaxis protein
LPIIAMTANAFAEERQACLDAGMNDHIAKPVDPDQMFATILSCLPANRGPATGAAPDASVSVEPAPPDFPDIVARLASIDGLDVAAGLSLLKQKVPSYLRILRLFAELHAQDGARLGDALARQAWSEILQLAHALKGAAGNIHADGIRAQAAALEGAARREHALELEAALPPLQRALPRLCAALLECLPPTPAPGRSGALDAARQSSILGQLKQLLQADDLEAQHFFREHRDELNPLLGDERFALLGPLIERFAYVEALRLLPIHDE